MLDYNDFILVETFEKELDALTLNEDLTVNEDLFHPMKTKRIKKALKDYQAAKVTVARTEAETEKKMERMTDKDAKDKLKKAMNRKKESAQELVDKAEDALSVNATTDSLKNLASYGKSEADIAAAKIRIKAEDDDAKRAQLEDFIKERQKKAQENKEKIEAAKKAEAEKQNNDSGNEENNNNNNNSSGNEEGK
jgi:hypothetical protein